MKDKNLVMVGLEKIKKIMRTTVIADGRNVFDKGECISKGFIYRSVGQ